MRNFKKKMIIYLILKKRMHPRIRKILSEFYYVDNEKDNDLFHKDIHHYIDEYNYIKKNKSMIQMVHGYLSNQIFKEYINCMISVMTSYILENYVHYIQIIIEKLLYESNNSVNLESDIYDIMYRILYIMYIDNLVNIHIDVIK